jgi:hypothetical protein
MELPVFSFATTIVTPKILIYPVRPFCIYYLFTHSGIKARRYWGIFVGFML